MTTSLHRPDAEIHHAQAACALWWRNTPLDPDGSGRIGCVGRFGCAEVEAGIELLEEACARLAAEGCKRIVGPMDGDTWHSYRLVSAGWDGAPRFFLEPWNTEEPVRAFEGAGFSAWARYSSSAFALAAPDEAACSRRARLCDRLESRGVSIRGIRLETFDEELDRLFELSSTAFTGNFLYTPIPRDEFLAIYQLVRPLVDPAFVRFAEKDGMAIGFVFALPDVSGADAPRLIVKTLAVHPVFRHLGLGTVLVDEVQEAARELGFREVVHALQHESNSSLKITGRHAGVKIREYTLYQRR